MLRCVSLPGIRTSWCVVLALSPSACNAFDPSPVRGTADVTPSVTAPATATCVNLVDNDGDGKFVRGPVMCPGQATSTGWTDCDDTDPNRAEREFFYRDGDGDGVGVWDDTTSACVGEPPAGYVVKPEVPDCDDADPQRQVMRLLDADGDGEGTRPPLCVAASSADFVPDDGEDCDDANAAVHHGHIESALDGIDSNCDGVEYPVRVSPSVDFGALEFAILDAARCSGEGLSIIAVEVWGVDQHGIPSNGGYVVVGNRGSETVLGATLTIREVATGSTAIEQLPPVAPREAIRVGGFETVGLYTFTLTPDMATAIDASPTNGTAPESDTKLDAGTRLGTNDAGQPPLAVEVGSLDGSLSDKSFPDDNLPDGSFPDDPPPCTPMNREGTINIPSNEVLPVP